MTIVQKFYGEVEVEKATTNKGAVNKEQMEEEISPLKRQGAIYRGQPLPASYSNGKYTFILTDDWKKKPTSGAGYYLFSIHKGETGLNPSTAWQLTFIGTEIQDAQYVFGNGIARNYTGELLPFKVTMTREEISGEYREVLTLEIDELEQGEVYRFFGGSVRGF